MKITNISYQPSFQSLKIGGTITNRLVKKNCPESFIQSVENTKKIILENKFNQKKYVDIILNCKENERDFYCVISSKKEGVPNNPSYRCKISENKDDILNFKKWLQAWDRAYSF